MAGKLTEAGIARTAARIGCEIACVRALVAVETLGSGFLKDGRPALLYERHIFSRRTKGQFDDRYPDISNPVRGGYGPAGEAQWNKLYRAMQLDPVAAQESCSWGLGQIMGFNWQLTGERSLWGFVHAMFNNEDAQLALMAEFIVKSGLNDELRDKRWAAFAQGYNGPAFRDNEYDTKLAAAYKRFAK